jgi:ABC-2 type transport system permease protein
MRATLTIANKDLKQRLRDRSAIILALLVPLGMAFIMDLTLGPLADESFNTAVVIADADGGPVAARFSALLDGFGEEGVVTVTVTHDEAAARAMVASHEASTAYLIPEGFSAATASNGSASLMVVTDPDQPIGSLVGEAFADGFVAELNAVRLSVGTAMALGASNPAILADAAVSEPTPVRLAEGQTEGRGFDFATFYATGITVFFLFFTVQFGVLGIIEEREDGTMPRLLAAPIPARSILVGKLLASFAMGVASAVVLWLSTTFLMGAEWGSSLGVILLIATGVAAAMGLTATVAAFTKTAEQAGSITAFIVVILGILGGTFFPVTRVTGALTLLSRVTPHFWLMEGFGRLSAGESIVDILPAVAAVMAFGVVFGTIGLFRVRNLVRYR